MAYFHEKLLKSVAKTGRAPGSATRAVVTICAVALLSWAAAACTPGSRGESSAVTDTLRGENLIRHAHGFQITDRGEYQLLSIFDPFHAQGDTLRYFLVKRGVKAPEGAAPGQVIQVPIRSLAVTSSLHVGAIERLEAWDCLVAVGDSSRLYSKQVRRKIREAGIAEIQKGPELNREKVISLQPDVLMVTGSPETGPGSYDGITRSGIPVIVNSEWMETSPLGRAEWIRLTAALLDRLNFADHQFAFVESSYTALADRVRQSAGDRKPGVLLGNEFQGTWHMPGGKSFMARLLADAGAGYHWSGNGQTGSIPLNYESVYPVALDAEVWLNIFVSSARGGKKELLSADRRYADFKSVKNDRLYSFTKRTDENGANDYWESSAFRPDLLLADYVHILHPGLLPDHLLYYCNKLD